MDLLALHLVCCTETRKFPPNTGIGYDVSNHDRLEMTIDLETQSWATLEDPPLPNGIEARALDLEKDDLVKVYDVLKLVRCVFTFTCVLV